MQKLTKKECELILQLFDKHECVRRYLSNWDLRNKLFWIIHDHYAHDKSNRGFDWKTISDVHFRIGYSDKICDVLREYINERSK